MLPAEIPAFLYSKNPRVCDTGVNPLGGFTTPSKDEVVALLDNRPSLAAENIERVECGIDKITLTFQPKELPSPTVYPDLDKIVPSEYEHKLLQDKWQALLIRLQSQGFKVSKAGFFGYQGQFIGGVFFGKREIYKDKTGQYQGGDYLLQAQGAIAHYVFVDFTPLATNCSSLDLQVTVWQKEYDYDLPEDLRDANRIRANLGLKRSTNGRPVMVQLHDSDTEGASCYYGSTASDARGVVYLKGLAPNAVESQANSIRYELRFRNNFAFDAWEQLSALRDMPQVLLDCIRATVLDWFASKLAWIPEIDGGVSVSVSSDKKETDVQKKLRWLSLQVAPTVEWLCSVGVALETLQALTVPLAAARDFALYKFHTEYDYVPDGVEYAQRANDSIKWLWEGYELDDLQ